MVACLNILRLQKAVLAKVILSKASKLQSQSRLT
jgi:hypothetical protein